MSIPNEKRYFNSITYRVTQPKRMSAYPLNTSEIELARKVNAHSMEDFYKKLALKDGWVLEKDDQAVKVWHLYNYGGSHVPATFKVQAVMKASIPTIKKYIIDTTARRSWDTGLKDIKTLVSLDNETDIINIELSSFAGGAISARDFIDVRTNRDIQEGMIEKFETISNSVDLTRVYPARSGYVRGRTFSTGIQLTNAVDANGDVIEDSTQFTLLSQVDTGGWLAYALVNATQGGVLWNMIINLRKTVESGAAPISSNI